MEKDYNEAVIDFFYDVYFKGREGHDYTDEQIAMSVTKMDIDKCVETARDALYEHFDINPGTNYVISGETKERLEKFLYRELEVDSTSVEINELLDLLEGTKGH